MYVRMHEILLFVANAALMKLNDMRFVVSEVICYVNTKIIQAEIRTSHAYCSLHVVMTARNSLLPAPTL
jgi:hypothetical protein